MLFRANGALLNVFVLGLFFLGACSKSDTTLDVDAEGDEDDSKFCQPMHAHLPPYNFQNNDVQEKDEQWLDKLATEYVCGLEEGEPIDDVYFFYGWAPIKVFNYIIDGKTEDIKKFRWFLHVSGYFGGLWLNNGLNQQEMPDGGLNPDDGNIPGIDFSMVNGVGIARAGAAAAAGDDGQIFQYNKNSLLAFLMPNLGLTWDFGYNRGYMLEIYLRPPKNITPPPDYVDCEGLLWCTYSDQRIPILTTLSDVSTKLESLDGRWQELREGSALPSLLPNGVRGIQNTANTLGTSVWGTFFTKGSMSDYKFYMDLLDVSASFLEVVQAGALLSAKGYADKDPESGRLGALIQSGLGPWLSAYMKSFNGPPGVGGLKPLPRIEPAE